MNTAITNIYIKKKEIVIFFCKCWVKIYFYDFRQQFLLICACCGWWWCTRAYINRHINIYICNNIHIIKLSKNNCPNRFWPRLRRSCKPNFLWFIYIFNIKYMRMYSNIANAHIHTHKHLTHSLSNIAYLFVCLLSASIYILSVYM